MTKEDIIQKVNNFISEDLEIDRKKLNPQARLKEDLGIDSLDFVDIVVIVENIFKFKIKAEDMSHVETLGQFYDYIAERTERGGK